MAIPSPANVRQNIFSGWIAGESETDSGLPLILGGAMADEETQEAS